MIQATQHKPVEVKAPKSAELSKVSEKVSAANSKTEATEAASFASELEAIMVEEKGATEAQDQPVVKADKAPTTEVVPVLELEEATEQKSFDPALTEKAEILNHPKSTEIPAEIKNPDILKLLQGEVPEDVKAELVTEMKSEAKGELAELLKKDPQILKGKEALVASTETAGVESKIMNLEDFVTHKNLAKKATPVQAYGLAKTPTQKVALESGLKATQVVKDAAALEGTTSAPVNSQQFILNMMSEQKNPAQVSDVQAAGKVFDMSQVKSGNADQIMTQITDYMVQAKASKEPTVSMRMNHEDLGIIDITVQKAVAGVGQEAVSINIGAHSLEGKNFFQQNSKDLLSHMGQAGITVSDFKVETPSQTGKNEFDFNGQNSGKNSGSEKHFGSEQNQRKHESDRRQELWKRFNKEAA
ncbi:MAG TPA: hypothetical protein VNJ01_10500 [Bacteriovoracaceae bacterium]|nr:hypothetical protein [Bacteriovoracaceae bacterium]